MNKMGESKIMKKYKGVVFFDYDGTTVDEVDEIKTATPTTVESLNKLKENGYLTNLWERSHVMVHIQKLREK